MYLFYLSCSNKKIYKNSNSFQGIVIKGKQEARKLDIPTANISIVPYSIQEGVYSCRVLVKEKQYKAMCYYDLERSNILEAYIFNFNEDLYNQTINIYLKNFIRKPVKNISFEEIKLLIKKDIESCYND
ncbi:riboflavin kinase [Rickettsia endosymbiont of Pantilius tunicatus]|uniref:riboflavin kinase n=1 Tax=Rickettsia endosymbiont of Pantilius tunicatus TaxID=3066267 RepID=UPI00376F202F